MISDKDCNVYLTSHADQVPLHFALPSNPPERRLDDGRVRCLGCTASAEVLAIGAIELASVEGSANEGDVILLSLVQLFSANYYSFVVDMLGRSLPQMPHAAPSDVAHTTSKFVNGT